MNRNMKYGQPLILGVDGSKLTIGNNESRQVSRTQIIDESEKTTDEIIPQQRILALPYYEIKEENTEQQTITEQEDKEKPIKQSKKERKKERNEFIGKTEIKEFKPEEQKEEPQLQQYDTHSDYDGKLIFQWMRTDFDRIRNKIYYCESPPISDYPEENMKIETAVEQYKQIGVFRDANKVKDYIESLMWYGKINPELFGMDNYILNETIMGYKEIYNDLMKLKDMIEGDEALRLLGKLILVASRPLVIDETLMKETQYEPSSSEGGVYGGEYNQEEDGI